MLPLLMILALVGFVLLLVWIDYQTIRALQKDQASRAW
jgi:hypothetical protein